MPINKAPRFLSKEIVELLRDLIVSEELSSEMIERLAGTVFTVDTYTDLPLTMEGPTLARTEDTNLYYSFNVNTQAWEALGGGGPGGTYVNPNPMPIDVGGYSAGTTFPVPETMQQMLDGLLYPYVAPIVGFGPIHPVPQYYEIGDSIPSVGLTSTVTKTSLPITDFYFTRDGVSLPHIPTDPGTHTYHQTDSTPVITDTIFGASANDGTTLVASSNYQYVFVYCYYYGVGAQHLAAADVALLTNDIASQCNKSYSFSPTNEVYYFAYPASYGVLTSILDTNGFETIGDWTIRTENITNTYGEMTSYFIYEFNNITTQTGFINTFIY